MQDPAKNKQVLEKRFKDVAGLAESLQIDVSTGMKERKVRFQAGIQSSVDIIITYITYK